MNTDKDREHMLNPNRWVHWPLLPLKHATQRDKDGMKRLALLAVAGVGGYAIAEDANLFERREDLKFKDTTIEEVLAAGWRVD